VAQTEFGAAQLPRPVRFWAFLATASLGGFVPAVVKDGVSSVYVLLTVPVVWLLFGVLVAATYWLRWRGGCLIRVSPEYLQVLLGNWQWIRIPWTDVEEIQQVQTKQLSPPWRLIGWLIGWDSRRRLADVRLRNMLRQTSGFGIPQLTKHAYLAPDDIEGFLDSTCAYSPRQ
jgi:hypothetical protein